MSFINSLKNGEIPPKNTLKKKSLTPYDEFVAKKNLKLKDKSRDIQLIKPKNFEETERLIDVLKDNKGIVVDFSILKPQDAQRMLDFLSGAVYALSGAIERIEQSLYIITPKDLFILNKLS